MRLVLRYLFILLVVGGTVAGLTWRLDLLHKSLENGPTGRAGVAEDRKLFQELLAAGVLISRPDGGLDRLPEDYLLLEKIADRGDPSPAAKQAREEKSKFLKALDFSAVGSIVRKQVDLWNQTRRIVAIRDNRPQPLGETRNVWQALNMKSRPLAPGKSVPETFGFIHDGELQAGFSDWRTVPDADGLVRFRTRVAVSEPTTLIVQVIGKVEQAPPGAKRKALKKEFRWACPEPAQAQVISLPLKPGAPTDIEITARPAINCSPRIFGLAISLDKDDNDKYTRYDFRPVKRSRPGGKFAIRTKDGVYLTGENWNGRPTPDAFRLGLLPIVGTGSGDTFSLSGLIGGSKLPTEGLTVDLTIDSRYQAAAQEAIEWGMARFPKKDRWARERKGGMVAIDAKTGAVLAVANYPIVPVGVHPWDVASFSSAFPLRDPSSVIAWEVVDKHNTPGSTFKPLVSLALMRHMRGRPEFEARVSELMRGIPPEELASKLGIPAGAGDYTPPGSTRSIKNFGLRSLGSYSGTPLRDSSCGPPPEDLNIGLRQMVKHSVNHWFARMAVIMEEPMVDRFMAQIKASNGETFAPPSLSIFDTARWLGVDDKAPLDLASNVPASVGLRRIRGISQDVLYTQLSKNALGGMAFRKNQGGTRRLMLFTAGQNGIGQSVSASPMHMAQAISAVAGGKKVRAYLLSRWGSLPLTAPPAEDLEVNPELLQLLRQGMKAVPENGTAAGAFRKWKDFRCRTYGKTGTADVSKGAGYNTGWFVGWRDPKGPDQRLISFACMTSHAAGAYRFGGSACAPVVARMLSALEPKKEEEEKKEKKKAKK